MSLITRINIEVRSREGADGMPVLNCQQYEAVAKEIRNSTTVLTLIAKTVDAVIQSTGRLGVSDDIHVVHNRQPYTAFTAR